MNKEEAHKWVHEAYCRSVLKDSKTRQLTISIPSEVEMHKIVDQLEPDHPKVKLPCEVGEDLEDWLAVDNVDDILDDLVCVYDGDHIAVRDWWESTLGATYLIADMARYGWEAEPEERFFVKPPEIWSKEELHMFKNDAGEVLPGIPNPAAFDSDVTQFTRAELKQYRLDSDIFTLVPVGVEK